MLWGHPLHGFGVSQDWDQYGAPSMNWSELGDEGEGSSPPQNQPTRGGAEGEKPQISVGGLINADAFFPPPRSPEQESDERKCNYERYRGLVQNDFAGSEWILG